jgi:hypothetical protein
MWRALLLSVMPVSRAVCCTSLLLLTSASTLLS